MGFILDTRDMVFRWPEEKVAKILDQVGVLITRRKSQHRVREVASVVGKLQAGVRALGQPVRVCMRALYRDIEKAPTWDWRIRLSEESVEELLFWQKNLSGLNSPPLRQSMAAVRVDIKMAGDASAAGVFLGDYTGGNTLLSLPFTEEQIKKSSTWRELFVLYTFCCSKEA